MMGSDAAAKYRSPRAVVRSPYKHQHVGLPLKYIAGIFFLCMMGTTLYMASVSGGIMKADEKAVSDGKAGVQAAMKNLEKLRPNNSEKNVGQNNNNNVRALQKTKPRLGSPKEDAAKANANGNNHPMEGHDEFHEYQEAQLKDNSHKNPPKELSPAEVVKQEPDKENLPVMAGHVDTPQHDESGQHMNLVSSIPKRRDGQWDNRWEVSHKLPEWAKDYFAWHHQSTQHRTRRNWREYRYLVMTCYKGQVCGNVAHRLRPLAGLMRLAYDTNRVLMIHWDSPDKLTNYLEPPTHGGIEWRVPDYMWKAVETSGREDQETNMQSIVKHAADADKVITATKYNDDEFAEPYFNDKIADNEFPADKVFHDIWGVMFKPTFQLKERVTETLVADNGLKPSEYATVHIEYDSTPSDEAEQKALRAKVENAMNCMSRLRPGGPFLVAAQTKEIAEEAVDYGEQHNVTIVAAQIAHDTSDLPKDLYQSFVEIYYMANSKCVAYGRNGYGQLGYILGFDYDCRVQYSGEREEQCEWQDAPKPDLHLGHSHLLKLPSDKEMEDLHSDKDVHMEKITPRKPHEDHGDKWEHAANMPDWAKDYFEWHKRQRTRMSPTNWQNFRFLVMTCLDAQRCGNVAHRLRPVAGMLRLAYDTNRLLMIHWDKPDNLEQYLEPAHHGGMDWSVPEYMMNTLRKTGQQGNIKILEQQTNNKDKVIVNAKYNDEEFAEPYYNQHVKGNEPLAEKALHDIWHVLFKPTFMLQERITETLRNLGIKEGMYSTVHIEYEKDPKTDAEKAALRSKVQNAMNCLSQINPGGPYLVAAQSYAVAKEAVDYGKSKGVTVASRQIAHDTSDLPEDLTNSMVEMYFMVNTRCAAYGRNGYGQLGYMLGYDYDCRIQYHGENGQQCEWKAGKPSVQLKP